LISKIRRVALRDEVENVLPDVVGTFPVTPEPFGSKTGDAENAEMDEDSDFRFVEPLKIKNKNSSTISFSLQVCFKLQVKSQFSLSYYMTIIYFKQSRDHKFVTSTLEES
jgi:hypothetical protein